MMIDPSRIVAKLGPYIGRYRDSYIPEWIEAGDGAVYEYVGISADCDLLRLADGECMIWPGLVYRRRLTTLHKSSNVDNHHAKLCATNDPSRIVARLADMACELDSLANAFDALDKSNLKACAAAMRSIAIIHDRRLGMRLYAEPNDGNE